ncbi:hypothetical protein P4114_02515 [Pseudomonas aeruginosa]|nr:hypothetical protein [Pseudomonas aeruginosa]
MRYVEEREQFRQAAGDLEPSVQARRHAHRTPPPAARWSASAPIGLDRRRDAEATLYCAMASAATDRCFDVCNEAARCTAATAISTIIRWSAGYATPAYQILEGTNETMRVIAARRLLGAGRSMLDRPL